MTGGGIVLAHPPSTPRTLAERRYRSHLVATAAAASSSHTVGATRSLTLADAVDHCHDQAKVYLSLLSSMSSRPVASTTSSLHVMRNVLNGRTRKPVNAARGSRRTTRSTSPQRKAATTKKSDQSLSDRAAGDVAAAPTTVNVPSEIPAGADDAFRDALAAAHHLAINPHALVLLPTKRPSDGDLVRAASLRAARMESLDPVADAVTALDRTADAVAVATSSHRVAAAAGPGSSSSEHPANRHVGDVSVIHRRPFVPLRSIQMQFDVDAARRPLTSRSGISAESGGGNSPPARERRTSPTATATGRFEFPLPPLCLTQPRAVVRRADGEAPDGARPSVSRGLLQGGSAMNRRSLAQDSAVRPGKPSLAASPIRAHDPSRGGTARDVLLSRVVIDL